MMRQTPENEREQLLKVMECAARMEERRTFASFEVPRLKDPKALSGTALLKEINALKDEVARLEKILTPNLKPEVEIDDGLTILRSSGEIEQKKREVLENRELIMDGIRILQRWVGHYRKRFRTLKMKQAQTSTIPAKVKRLKQQKLALQTERESYVQKIDEKIGALDAEINRLENEFNWANINPKLTLT